MAENEAPERIFAEMSFSTMGGLKYGNYYSEPGIKRIAYVRADLAAPDAAQGNEQRAREIIKHISDAALELAFVRHCLTSDEVIVDDDADVKARVQAEEEFCERIKEDTLACLTGDDTGCLDPEELDENNCELLWLQARLPANADAVRQARPTIIVDAEWIVGHHKNHYDGGCSQCVGEDLHSDFVCVYHRALAALRAEGEKGNT